MSSALVPQQSAFPTGTEFDAMRNAAAIISRSGLVPEAFRGKPEDVMVAILTARGLGLDPMVALQKGYIVKGKFDIEVSVKLGLVQSRVPDYDYEVIELNDERCVIEGGRAGKKRVRSEFTYAQAVAAGLTAGKYGPTPTWQFYRQDMLMNRALGRNLKATCAFALYNMPLALDEPENEAPPIVNGAASAPAVAERSGAVVVDEPAATPAESVATPPGDATTANTPPLAGYAGPPQPVPVDWRGRFLEAVRAHYNIKAGVPDAVPGRNKWLKSADSDGKVLRLVNLFYADVKEPEVAGWIAVPPMDYERIALWLEAHAAKRAGGEGPHAPSGSTEATPAPQDAPAAVQATVAPGDAPEVAMPPDFFEEDAPPAPDPVADFEPPLVAGYEALAAKGLLHMLTVFDGLAMATKGERKFYSRSGKTKRPILLDGPILTACGYLGAGNAPTAQWLDTIAENKAPWLMLCCAVHEECVALNVKYL